MTARVTQELSDARMDRRGAIAPPLGSRSKHGTGLVLACLCLLSVAGCASREELQADAAELEALLASSDESTDVLDSFEVVEAEFLGRVEGRPGTAQFNITVRNGTEHAVQRIQFDASLSMEGEVLLEGKVSTGTPGGVEPGDDLSFVMFPMPGSSWETYDPPEDAELTLTPIRLEGFGSRVLAESISAERRARIEAELASLRADLE